MNVKKQVWDRIVKLLELERRAVQDNISRNQREFRRLVEEQRILKRERAAIDALIRDAGVEVKP